MSEEHFVTKVLFKISLIASLVSLMFMKVLFIPGCNQITITDSI